MTVVSPKPDKMKEACCLSKDHRLIKTLCILLSVLTHLVYKENNNEILIFILRLLYPYQWQVSTAGFDLIFYVGHLSLSPHMATICVTEITGGVEMSVKLI